VKVRKIDHNTSRISAPQKMYAIKPFITNGEGLVEKRYLPKTTSSRTNIKVIPKTFGNREYVNTAKLSRNLVFICKSLFT
jgi:hypothetical protein